MKLHFLLILIPAIFIQQVVRSQSLTGIWLVEKVQVGDEQMTPVSKWFKFHENGDYESGNGWLQNTIGTWSYDSETQEFSATNKLGIKDEAGPFKIETKDETMVWSREEDGSNVKVHLQQIQSIPPSYTDLLSGLWKLTETAEQSEPITSGPLTGLNHVLLRWDRIYRATDQDKKSKTGYWHVNGHRPVLTLLPHQAEQAPESWHIQVSEQALELTGTSDSNKDQVKNFIRIHQFPK
jgi:hypothetical protein